jgi:hypothetical protein
MTMALDTRNPAYASVEEAERIAVQMAKIGEAGWTRPDVLAAFGQLGVVGVTDSVVYRAQREKIHGREVPIFDALFAAIEAGTVKPRVKASKKAKVADVAEKAYAAAAKLAEFGDVSKAKVDALRALFAQLAEVLPEPKATEPEAPADPQGDEPQGDDAGSGEGGEGGNTED